jgi:hypothetical protein
MKVSLPQLLMYPDEKCGRPAAIVGASGTLKSVCSAGRGEARLGESAGSRADLRTAVCCTEPRARALTKLEPCCTAGDMSDLNNKQIIGQPYITKLTHVFSPSLLKKADVDESDDNVKVPRDQVTRDEFEVRKDGLFEPFPEG